MSMLNVTSVVKLDTYAGFADMANLLYAGTVMKQVIAKFCSSDHWGPGNGSLAADTENQELIKLMGTIDIN